MHQIVFIELRDFSIGNLVHINFHLIYLRGGDPRIPSPGTEPGFKNKKLQYSTKGPTPTCLERGSVRYGSARSCQMASQENIAQGGQLW